MSDRPSFMADYGERLVDNGYPVIPIMPGSKVPGRFTGGQWSPYPDWTRHCDRPTKVLEVDIWRHWPGCAVGVAGGVVVGIDLDILDGDLAIRTAELATDMLGDTPCLRVGRAPKRLLVYRTTAPFGGRKRHPLEVLARGQQFVAYAVHPDTGRPYDWPQEGLAEVPLSRLSAVDEAGCAAFLDAAWRLLPRQVRQASLLDHAPTSAWRGPSGPRGTLDAVTAALEYLPNEDLPWEDWFRIGMALKGALGEEGRELWLAWSKSASKSGSSGKADTAERFWASARPHSIGAGTIYWLAEQRGWVSPPELTLSGDAAERAGQPHPAASLLAKVAAEPAQPVTPAPRPYRVPPELLEVDGALQLFVDYATATAVSPQPFLALGAALCLVGAVAGRRYRTPTDLRSNLYAIGIADSGGGKDHARRCAKRALYAAGLERIPRRRGLRLLGRAPHLAAAPPGAAVPGGRVREVPAARAQPPRAGTQSGDLVRAARSSTPRPPSPISAPSTPTRRSGRESRSSSPAPASGASPCPAPSGLHWRAGPWRTARWRASSSS